MFKTKETLPVDVEKAGDKSEFPQEHSTISSTYSLYTVEARCNDKKPIQIGGTQLFGSEWQAVQYEQGGTVGVPSGRRMEFLTGKDEGLYPYAAAQALRWWLHANAEALGKDFCLETRIVKHQVVFTKKITVESASEILSQRNGPLS